MSSWLLLLLLFPYGFACWYVGYKLGWSRGYSDKRRSVSFNSKPRERS